MPHFDMKAHVCADKQPAVGETITVDYISLHANEFDVKLSPHISLNGIVYHALPVQHGNQRPRAIDM